MRLQWNLLIVIVLFLSACSYNKEELLFPDYCNTQDVTYSSTIRGIINTYNCLSCHGPVNPYAGFSLDTYAGVKTKVDENRLIGAITHAPGFSPMPQNAAKMSKCDIDKIKKWIENGAPNN